MLSEAAFVGAGWDNHDTSPQALVSIVDDDPSVRESLPDLLKMFGLVSETFSSAEKFLTSDGISRTQCLILDISMAGMSRTRSCSRS